MHVHLRLCIFVLMCATYMQVLAKPKEGVGSHGTRVISGCELLDVCAGN